MTNREALYWCEQFENNIILADPNQEKMVLALQAMKQCKKALEKQIPKKPIAKDSIAYDGSLIDTVFVCPICNRAICTKVEDAIEQYYITKEHWYCWCGQALDWSDAE